MANDQTLIQLDEYYKINIQHLCWSFWSSMATLFVGVIVLIVGIGLIIRGDSSLTSILSVLGGVITQFVGAGFFVFYSQNLKQLNIFYEKLIKHKDTLYAISLANNVSEPNKSNAILAVIGNLLSRGEPPTSPDVLKAIIENKNKI